jgi:hypothetical protein
MLGALGGIVSMVCTVTAIPFMPDGWAASAGGFPAMTETVAFLMKDVALLAASFYLLKQDAKRNAPGLMRWSLLPPVSVEQVARRTVHGLIAKRRHVYCATQSYLVSLVSRFAPWMMDLVFKLMFRGREPPQLPSPESQLPARSA